MPKKISKFFNPYSSLNLYRMEISNVNKTELKF